MSLKGVFLIVSGGIFPKINCLVALFPKINCVQWLFT